MTKQDELFGKINGQLKYLFPDAPESNVPEYCQTENRGTFWRLAKQAIGILNSVELENHIFGSWRIHREDDLPGEYEESLKAIVADWEAWQFAHEHLS
jgi:hypothetical protein